MAMVALFSTHNTHNSVSIDPYPCPPNKLVSAGINDSAIAFATLTMESEKYICVREQVGDKNEVVIVDLATQAIDRKPISADSAIMHLEDNIIALKAAKTLQIYNLATKTKLKAHTMTEDVTFWRWVDVQTLGLITERAVYHWSLEGDAPPAKIFDRHDNLKGAQIINYRTNVDRSWCILIGIAARDSRVVGTIQLYSTERAVPWGSRAGWSAAVLLLKTRLVVL